MCKCQIHSTAPKHDELPPPSHIDMPCPQQLMSDIIADLYSGYGMEKFKDAIVTGTKVLRDEEMRELILTLQKALCNR